MGKWKEKRLNDLCSFAARGITPQYVENGIPVINQKCIRDNKVDLSLCKFTNNFQKIIANKYVQYGDILINSTGTGTLGRVAIYRHHATKITADGHVTILHTNDDVNSFYLGYYLHSVEPIVENLGRGSTNQMELSPTDLMRIKILLPDLPTQKWIVDILSAYDDLIENNNKRINVLEQMAENLYKEWFVRFRFPGHETTKFVNGLPDGWEILKVSKIATIKAGGDRPVVFSNDPTEQCPIPVFSNGLDNDGLYGYTDKAIIEKESVTISARGTVGFVCLRRKPYVPIVRLVSIVPKDQFVTPLYLYYYLQRDSVIANGTSQQQITVPMVSRKRIIIPPNSLLQEFDKREYSMWNLIEKLKEQNQNLIKQRDLLLPRLMSGKLEV